MFDYEEYLRDKLNTINENRGYGLKVLVVSEQVFVKPKSYSPETIYVILKKLSTEYMYNVLVQPVQLMVFAEQDKMDTTKALIDEFTNTYNWINEIIDGQNNKYTYVKQQYSNAVVLSNFNIIGVGYRTVLYITGDLAIMENVCDISSTIDNVEKRGSILVDSQEVKPLTFNMTYTMTGNTQPVGSSKIATTQKTMSTFALTMSVQMIDSNFLNKVLDIMNGTTNGNAQFTFSFSLNGKSFNATLKMVNCQIATSPNNVPTIQLGFMR